MSYQHNLLAFEAGEWILDDLRSGRSAWAGGRFQTQVTPWPGIMDWPVPDRMFEDGEGVTLAVEFKPPGQPKREYVTGIGQIFTYLRTFKFGALVLPERSADGFEIATYVRDIMREQYAVGLPVSILSYSVSASLLTTVVPLRDRVGAPPVLPPTTRRAFWAYVRDASHFDVFDVLSIMEQQNCRFATAYARFWNTKRLRGQARALDGTFREPKRHRFSEANRGDRAERTNINLLMRHVFLIDADGRMTERGHELLRHGKVYTAASESFRRRFGGLLLTVGRHLDLILWVDRFQRELVAASKQNHSVFKHSLDEGLEAAGFIRSAPQGAPKETFIRDESKYWNQMGLLERTGARYFHPGVGYVFDWRAIISMVDDLS